MCVRNRDPTVSQVSRSVAESSRFEFRATISTFVSPPNSNSETASPFLGSTVNRNPTAL